ncbi:FHA domain-containing protein [Homoserinimonas sp. A520]
MSTSDDNPFLIPPPPPGIAPVQRAAGAQEPDPVDPASLITLPPGIVDSGTYRMPSTRAPKPSTLDDAPAFFPVGAPGLPVPTLAEQVAPAPEVPTVDDATRASVGRRSAPAWRLTLPDGQQALVEKTTLVGRDPAHSPQWHQALLLPIADTGKTVSKTHAALELTASGQLVVHDLNSTNGVFLEYAGGNGAVVEPGTPALVEHGAELSFGEFTVSVERS